MEEVIQNVVSFIERYITIPKVGVTDIVEIVIIAALIYEIMI